MSLRSLLMLIIAIITGKWLGKEWNTSSGFWKIVSRLALFCIAFFVPLYWLKNSFTHECIHWAWLLPLLLSAGVLYTYFLWPTGKCCCTGSACDCDCDTDHTHTTHTHHNHTVQGIHTAPVETIRAENVRPDNLKKIEGIGPKIEQLLHNSGILTFKQLATTAPDTIKEILIAGGPNFELHDPTTRPMQADLAAQGKWDTLAALQEELDGGKI